LNRDYLNQGAHYSYNDPFKCSFPLLYKIEQLDGDTGKCSLASFMKLFRPEQPPDLHLLIGDRPLPLPEPERAAIFLAALTTVSGTDVKDYFKGLHFVIGDDAYARGLAAFAKSGTGASH
jgi:hypothetical protein